IRYGIFIVNDKVHIPERYPSTTNVVMVINESEITNDNIKDFFNRIRTRNHNISQGKQTQFYGSGETILNKTDRAIIAAHTDTVETIFKNLSNKTWVNEKERLNKMVLDIIGETRICTAITELDRKGSRYESKLYKCKYLYYFNDNEYKYKEKRGIKNDQNSDAFNIN
ncbi:29831_t:CDS:1, partial [Racocetra persica]